MAAVEIALRRQTNMKQVEMSSKLFVTRSLMALAAVLIVASVATAAEPTAPGKQLQAPAAGSQEAAGPQIDPLAERIVRRACTTLADAKVFTFHAEVTFDQVLPSSEVKLQFAGATDYSVRKPARSRSTMRATSEPNVFGTKAKR
jgi:hypothetical protein